MSDIISGPDVIRAVVNDIEVRMKQQGYAVAYTEGRSMRLIDAIGLKQSISVSAILEDGKTLEQIIDNAPTIEERKSGKWIPFDIPWYQCSECGAVREHKSFMENYCPNCGAKMRG